MVLLNRQILLFHFAVILLVWLYVSHTIYLVSLSRGFENNGHHHFGELLERANIRRERKHSVHVVVSHCDESIGWIQQQFRFATKHRTRKQITNSKYDVDLKYNLKSFTVITKCNTTIPINDLPKTTKGLVQIVSLPNVGRCDHSYAYWIKEVLEHAFVGADQREPNHDPQQQQQPPYRHKLLYSNHRDDERSEPASSSSSSSSSHEPNPFGKIANTIDSTDLVLFLKDNDNTYRGAIEGSIGILDTLDLLAIQYHAPSTTTATTYDDLILSHFSRPITRGLACQSYPEVPERTSLKFTNLAHRGILWDFKLEEYSRLSRDSEDGFVATLRPMGKWINHLPTTTPSLATTATNSETTDLSTNPQQNQQQTALLFSKEYYQQVAVTDFNSTGVRYRSHHKHDLVPVCYGGVFATYWGQLASKDSPLTKVGWNAVVKALGRGDNIEEGHYMERWWGDLLSFSSYADTRVMQKQQQKQVLNTNNPIRVSGITLLDAEITKLFKDKLKHVQHKESSYGGIVNLGRGKLEKREKLLLLSDNTTTTA